MWEDESVKLLLIAESGETCFPDNKKRIPQNSWCLRDGHRGASGRRRQADPQHEVLLTPNQHLQVNQVGV